MGNSSTIIQCSVCLFNGNIDLLHFSAEVHLTKNFLLKFIEETPEGSPEQLEVFMM